MEQIQKQKILDVFGNNPKIYYGFIKEWDQQMKIIFSTNKEIKFTEAKFKNKTSILNYPIKIK